MYLFLGQQSYGNPTDPLGVESRGSEWRHANHLDSDRCVGLAAAKSSKLLPPVSGMDPVQVITLRQDQVEDTQRY